MQKSEPWDRYTKKTISQKIMFFTFNVHSLTKVRFLTPFFDGVRPITTTCRNCNYPICTNYVSCDHPSIIQAKMWCFSQRVSDKPMKWMSKIRVFWLYSYLTNELNIYLIGRLIINYTYMKHKGFWGFGVLGQQLRTFGACLGERKVDERRIGRQNPNIKKSNK